MARNSFLSNFLTIVFTLFEGKNIHLKVIKRPKAMCLAGWGGEGRGEEGVSSPLPKRVGGEGSGNKSSFHKNSRRHFYAGF